MIDTSDKKTIDAFPAKRGRGRPVTSTAEKRRLDTAERQRRFRERQKIKAFAVEQAASDMPNSRYWLSLVLYMEGKEPLSEAVGVSYYNAQVSGDAGYGGWRTYEEFEQLVRRLFAGDIRDLKVT